MEFSRNLEMEEGELPVDVAGAAGNLFLPFVSIFLSLSTPSSVFSPSRSLSASFSLSHFLSVSRFPSPFFTPLFDLYHRISRVCNGA